MATSGSPSGQGPPNADWNDRTPSQMCQSDQFIRSIIVEKLQLESSPIPSITTSRAILV
ncbi:hypothetical protein DXG01_010345, partial [Tephrocybe rancida]